MFATALPNQKKFRKLRTLSKAKVKPIEQCTKEVEIKNKNLEAEKYFLNAMFII